MNHQRILNTTVAGAGSVAVAVLATLLIHSPQVKAESRDGHGESRINRGFAIAPVPLRLAGKNRDLVGLGSYIVNAASGCNGCHTNASASEYAAGAVPYFGQLPAKVNPAVYLGGGRDFGQFPAPGPFPHIVSRNLTPDAQRLPAGHTFPEFLTIMRSGIDFDHVHPTCQGAPNGSCLPAPLDGALLQIMPWPTAHNMTERDLLAIYTYLSTIPCLEGDPGVPPPPGPTVLRCR
jgi:hypothetical protein